MRVDDYETARPRRRQLLELILTRQEREELLLEWGASFQQIIDSIRSNIKVKNQRRRTVNNSDRYDRWEEAVENAGRKLKRRLMLKKSSRQKSQELSTPAAANTQPVNGVLRGKGGVAPKPAEQRPLDQSKTINTIGSKSIDDGEQAVTVSRSAVLIEEPEPGGPGDEFDAGNSRTGEVDPFAPLTEVTMVEKTTISDQFYSYMEEMTVQSALTTESGFREDEEFDVHQGPSMPDGFELLDRDSSFWLVAKDGADFPRIRRTGDAMIISEEVGGNALSHFDLWDSNGGYGPSAPPTLPKRSVRA